MVIKIRVLLFLILFFSFYNQLFAETVNPDTINLEEIQSLLFIEPLDLEKEKIKTTVPSPSASAGAPLAFGSDWRSVGIGFSYTTPGEDTLRDAAIGIGIGLGNGDKLGFDLSIGFIDVDDFGGQIGFKLHHRFNQGNTAIALGWANPITFGDLLEDDENDTVYGVISHKFSLRPQAKHKTPVTLSFGLGNGGFRTFDDITDDDNSVGIFASVGIRVLPRLSVNTGWTGSQWNLTGSISPLSIPLIINMTALDLTDEKEAGTRLGISIGYGFKF